MKNNDTAGASWIRESFNRILTIDPLSINNMSPKVEKRNNVLEYLKPIKVPSPPKASNSPVKDRKCSSR